MTREWRPEIPPISNTAQIITQIRRSPAGSPSRLANSQFKILRSQRKSHLKIADSQGTFFRLEVLYNTMVVTRPCLKLCLQNRQGMTREWHHEISPICNTAQIITQIRRSPPGSPSRLAIQDFGLPAGGNVNFSVLDARTNDA